jgi:hypothetical protein
MRMTQWMVGAGMALVSLAAAPLAQAQPDYDDDSGYSQAPYGQSAQPGYSGSYSQDPARAQQDYEQRQRQYRDDYSTYQDQRGAYDVQRQAYEHRRALYERQRADYDAEYGQGAFDRYYRDHPEAYDDQFGPGAYARDFGGHGYGDRAYEGRY